MNDPLTRRGLLLTAAAATTAPAAAQPAPSLDLAARRRGRFFGCAVRHQQLQADSAYSAAVDRECSWLTPEIELKWAALEPARGQLALAPMDDLALRARATGKKVHGHTLVWDRSVPGWAGQALRDDGNWDLVHRYMASVMPRYGDVITRWDVVNEPIDTETGSAGLRQGAFLAAFGPPYIARALETARLFAPKAELMINEYGLEHDTAEAQRRRRRLLQLIDDLRRGGVPLNGVGLQGHLDLRLGVPPQRPLAAFLRELAARDLFVVITELDVKEGDYTLPAPQRDAAVAAATRGFLDVVLDQPAVRGVITWGLSDRYSWLEVEPADLQRHPGAWADGAAPGLNRGLPLDAALARKPMYEAIAAAFAA